MNDVTTKSAGPLTYLDAGHRQYPKLVTAQPGIALNGARLKWYDLACAETPVPRDIRQMARDHLTAGTRAERLGLDAERAYLADLFSGTV